MKVINRFMFSTIPQTKYGNCSKCGLQDTDVVKIKKDLFCLSCNRDMKGKQQIARANQKTAVRGLIKYERAEGILDSVQELILDLDRVVSKYVRLAAIGKDHKCKCYTCGTRKYWARMQCGHFIPRTHLGLRWESTNNKVQCPNCNINLRGNLKVYADNLERDNKGIVQWLQDTAREVYSPTRDELKQLLFDYQQKLHIVEQKLKL